MNCVAEMLTTTGTVRAAMALKSGSVCAAPTGPGAFTVGAGVDGRFCAPASFASRIRPVSTMLAVKAIATSSDNGQQSVLHHDHDT